MRPVIEQIENFDATTSKTIRFFYGGEASYGSRLRIYDVKNFTTPVYVNDVLNMHYTNSIIADNLINGKQYAAEIISYSNVSFQDIYASEVSNKVYFWCLSKPIFKFTNIVEGEMINSQSFTAELFYEQADGYDLSQFKYEIYDSRLNLISSSPYYSNYDENSSYNFNGLENNEVYYIRAEGVTTMGQIVDTGYISVFILFQKPDNYSVLYAQNDNSGNGIIEYNTNIILIEPTRDKDEYDYDYGFINLEDDTIVYNQNFIIDGDFIMAVRHKSMVGDLLRCSNTNRGFTLSIIECKDIDKFRYKLVVPNEISNYILYSEPFYMDGENILTCWIRRKNNIYELTTFVEDDMSADYNLFLGELRPISDLEKYDVWIDTDNNPTIRIAKEDVVIWTQLEEPSENLNENDIWIDVNVIGRNNGGT